ncbi:hypothetical protein [uncultured Stenotrophomonas sp.]|uniref:hypothetical protein n=1 Tax=uncultured Stenotrophomonas sp. TaxID=165438 RepID=UPI0025D01FC9|nr:hypothetical protein [uncultured Stenotrophomonas sp.]
MSSHRPLTEVHPATTPQVVVADPNPWIRRELSLQLQPYLAASAILQARSPTEVLTHIADPQCRMLVIDPCMPTPGQTDGLPLLRHVFGLRPDLHIFVLAMQPQQLLRDRTFPRQIAHVHDKHIASAWLAPFIAQALMQYPPA